MTLGCPDRLVNSATKLTSQRFSRGCSEREREREIDEERKSRAST